jgi:hypothetical protein
MPVRELSSYSEGAAPTTGAVSKPPAGGAGSSKPPAPGDGDLGGALAAPDAGAEAVGNSSDAGGVADAGAPGALLTCDAPGELVGNAGQCYLFGAEAASWAAASAACTDWGGTLVRIDSPEEEDLINQNTVGDSWIGLNDLETEGEMRWGEGGALATFTDWAPNQPDDFDGSEDCVELLADGRGYNDRPCTDLRAYVCER